MQRQSSTGRFALHAKVNFHGKNQRLIYFLKGCHLTLKVYSHRQWGYFLCQWGYFWMILRNQFWKTTHKSWLLFSEKKWWFFTIPFFKGKVVFEIYEKYVFLFVSRVFFRKITAYWGYFSHCFLHQKLDLVMYEKYGVIYIFYWPLP